ACRAAHARENISESDAYRRSASVTSPRSLSLELRKNQVAVAELVPEVSARERFAIAAFEQLLVGDGLQHLQVGRLGLVPARDEAVDDADPALRADDVVRPSLTGDKGAVSLRDRLERAHGGRPDRDHAS